MSKQPRSLFRPIPKAATRSYGAVKYHMTRHCRPHKVSSPEEAGCLAVVLVLPSAGYLYDPPPPEIQPRPDADRIQKTSPDTNPNCSRTSRHDLRPQPRLQQPSTVIPNPCALCGALTLLRCF